MVGLGELGVGHVVQIAQIFELVDGVYVLVEQFVVIIVIKLIIDQVLPLEMHRHGFQHRLVPVGGYRLLVIATVGLLLVGHGPVGETGHWEGVDALLDVLEDLEYFVGFGQVVDEAQGSGAAGCSQLVLMHWQSDYIILLVWV